MNQENKQGFSSKTITTKLEYIHWIRALPKDKEREN